MQRIQKTFKKGPAFIGYLTAGDGGIERTLEAARALIAGGVNMLEIGMPFSDPIADGPVIQRANTRALEQGTTLQDVLWLTQKVREKSNVPIILFSYLNPLLHVLNTTFFKDAKEAGIDGILLVDCPLELSHDIHHQCIENKIAPIYIIATTTPEARIHQISKRAKGFIYYACRKGTTGVRDGLPSDFAEKINQIKNITSLPLAVGFGISTRETAKEVLQHADGVIVGSLFVRAVEDGMSSSALTDLAKSINPL